jgi:hypothetical protein
MWIMVAGPYRSGTSDPEQRAMNLRRMNDVAHAVFRKGHVPVIGVNMALPIIECAGPEKYEEIMTPLSLSLAERCDAVIRIGGSSAGADAEVASFRARGLPVFGAVEEIPLSNHASD